MSEAVKTIHVEGMGPFSIRKRTLRVEIAIGAEYNRLIEGQEQVTEWFGGFCNMVAYLKNMIVTAPNGWSLDDLDPGARAYDQLTTLYQEVQDAEHSFRRSPAPGPEADRASPGG